MFVKSVDMKTQNEVMEGPGNRGEGATFYPPTWETATTAQWRKCSFKFVLIHSEALIERKGG